MVLIEMQMPRSCDGCPICTVNTSCGITKKFVDNAYVDGVRDADCPLKQWDIIRQLSETLYDMSTEIVDLTAEIASLRRALKENKD